jgi:predicted solute-binding protein
VRVSPYPHLEKLAIGCVQYLNAKPLIFGYEGKVCFDHPSRLADSLSKGLLDVALVSTFELLRMPGYDVVDGVSISSKGEVFSVFLAYKGKLEDIKTVSLDAASLTGVHLLRCILAEYYQLQPEYVSSETGVNGNVARLLIGNQAIDFRREHRDDFQYLDLGAEWMKQTSLPFVFALWLVRRGAPDACAAARELRRIKEHGTSSIPEIVRKEKRYDAAFETQYLTTYIRYDLDPAEKAGIEKYRELLAKYGFISKEKPPLVFI